MWKTGPQILHKTKILPTQPSFRLDFQSKGQKKRKEKSIEPFGLRIKPTLEECKITLTNILEGIILKLYLGLLKNLVIRDLSKLLKIKIHSDT